MHPEVQLCPFFNARVNRIQQPEKIIIGPPACIASILLPRAHLQLLDMSVKRRGGYLQRMDPLRRGIYDPVPGTFYSGSFSFHLISPAPPSLGIARDSSHLSASNRVLGAIDWSIPDDRVFVLF